MKERTEVNPAQNLALALCGTNFRNQVYPSGHMFYLDKASFDQFRKDAEAWYAK